MSKFLIYTLHFFTLSTWYISLPVSTCRKLPSSQGEKHMETEDPIFCLFVSFLSWKIWLNSSVGIGGNPQGPMGVPIQRNTHPEGQATVSPVTTLPLKNVGGGGQRGWLRPGWNCTQEKFLSPYFTRWCNIGDCFGNHRLCKFPGIKQKEQLTKERRKSPTDKRPISSLNYPL